MNTPKWTHISISPSIFPPTCTYTFTTLHLHTLFRNPKTLPHHHFSLLKCLKKEEEEENKEEKSQKKERNKKLQEGK